MSDNDAYDDSNVEEEVKSSEGWRNLRASHIKLAKELAEARAALDKAHTAKRTDDLGGLLKARSVSEKVAKYFPSDVDVTAESVDKWLGENADVFGVTPPGSTEQTKIDTPGATEATKITEAAATALGVPPAGLDNVQQRLRSLDPKDGDFMDKLAQIMVAASP